MPGPTLPSSENNFVPLALTAFVMYGSLALSLMAALLMMMEKQWLNWYLLPAGGSTVERCRNRQRKLDRLQAFQVLPATDPRGMIQLSLFLVAFGLCARTMCTNIAVGASLIVYPLLALFFYTRGLAGMYLSEPLSRAAALAVLRGLRLGKETLHRVWDFMLCQVYHVFLWLPSVKMGHRSHHPSLPTVQPAPQNPTPQSAPSRGRPPHDPPPQTVHPTPHAIPLPTTWGISPNFTGAPVPLDQTSNSAIGSPVTAPPWLTPTALATLQEANADDAKCVSWVLQYITDPEALDAAIRFAAVIRWHEEGLDMEEPYKLIVSTLEECFSFTGTTPPGLRDRAYYSVQAVLWIRICRRCVPGSPRRPILPVIPRNTTYLDRDLRHLLGVCSTRDIHKILTQMYFIGPEFALSTLQWASNAILHLSWTRRGFPETFDSITKQHTWGDWSTIPLNAVLNRLLVWCTFLGWRVDMDALRVQDKSCVISYFRPASFSRCRCQSPHRTDRFSIVPSNRFSNPHLSSSTRSPLAHAG